MTSIRYDYCYCLLGLFVVTVLLMGNQSRCYAEEQFAYPKKIQQIINKKCFDCHSGNEPDGGLNLKTLHSLMMGGEGGLLLSQGN